MPVKRTRRNVCQVCGRDGPDRCNVCLGVAVPLRGKPLSAFLKTHVSALRAFLETHDASLFSRVYRDRPGRVFQSSGSFLIGFPTCNNMCTKFLKVGRSGFTKHPFNNLAVCNLHPIEKKNIDWRKLIAYHLICNIMEAVDPEWCKNGFQAQVAKHEAWKPCKVAEHKDSKDASFQYLFTFGDFDGCFNHFTTRDGRDVVIDTRHKLIKFDGRLSHSVDFSPRFAGSVTRFSVALFKTFDPALPKEGAPIVSEPEVLAEW